MALSTRFAHVVSEEELQKLWGVSARELAKLAKRSGFPAPTDPPPGGQPGVWRSIPDVRNWLTTTGYRTPRQLPLDWWPDSTEPAEFDRAQRATTRHGRQDAVAQHWSTESGHLVVFWQDESNQVRGTELAEIAPKADSYVLVGWDWGTGPTLFCWTGQDPDAERIEVSWADLARVLARPAPFWPSKLRKPELIAEWQPGDAPVRDVGKQDLLDVSPITRMALQYPVDHVVHRALIHTAQLIDSHTEAAECTDLHLLQERLEDGVITPDQITLAALPAEPVTDERPAPIDETVIHAGWREILNRADRLAEQCVHSLMAWDGGKTLPWSQTLVIPHSAARAEWLDRLELAEERTAIYAGLEPDPSERGVAMRDPLTDVPVLLPEGGGEVRALAPRRLPTTSPLAEIILEPEIWIRTQDGTLYPAPLHSYGGLSWGYGGSGPHTLATLAHRLLDDIAAPAPTVGEGKATPEGLDKLFTHPWPSGTVITRQQLLDAC